MSKSIKPKNVKAGGEAAKKARVEIIDSDDDFATTHSEGSYASMEEPEEKKVEVKVDANDKKTKKSGGAMQTKKEYTQEQLDAEANITYHEVVFIGHAKIPASELVTNGKSGHDLNGNGDIVFSVDNGRLKIGKHTNAEDFAHLTCGMPPQDAKKSKKKNAPDSSTNLDIVKSVQFEDFKFNYDNQFIVSADTIPKYANEGFYGNSACVNEVIMPGAMSRTGSDKLELLNRSISTRVILFQNEYPGVSLDTFAKDIQPAREDLSFVHFGSPLIGAINDAREADTDSGIYSAPTQGLERTMQVLVPTKLVKKYEKKTLDIMKNSISYANVVNGFKLTFTAPIPDYRLAAHRQWVKTNKQEGLPFLAFADPHHRMNASLAATFNNSKKESVNLSDLPDLEISFKCKVQYRHISNEPIHINSV